jgi:Tfp pilus assembly protein PilN
MQYKMIDVNNAQYKQDTKRLQSLRTQVVLWLVVLALGVVLIPMMLITRWVRNDVTRLESELLSVQSTLEITKLPSAEMVKLSAAIASIEQLASALHTVTLPSGVNWPIVMGAASRFDPTSIEITSLTQTGDRLQIAGRAASNDAVVRYQQILLDSGAFKDVVVVSMSTLPPTPVVTDEADEDAARAANDPIQPPLGNVEYVIDLVVGTSAP